MAKIWQKYDKNMIKLWLQYAKNLAKIHCDGIMDSTEVPLFLN